MKRTLEEWREIKKDGVSLAEASFNEIFKLPRDNYSAGDFHILTDGCTVYLSEQKIFENPTQTIMIPQRVFNRLIGYYTKKQRIKK